MDKYKEEVANHFTQCYGHITKAYGSIDYGSREEVKAYLTNAIHELNLAREWVLPETGKERL